MFESPAAARSALEQAFDPPTVEAMVRALVPAIVLWPAAEGHVARLGDSRLGGTPDLPPGQDWPRPPAPADPEAIAGRANAEAAAVMRRHMADGLPYAFVGQVDLAEAAALGPFAAPLPAEGRLLFFHDQAVGPWETGTRTARVIWDRTPRDALVPSAMPADLAAAAARERRELETSFAAADLNLPDPIPSVYAAPPRAAVPTLVHRLPDVHSLESAGVPGIFAKPYHEMDADEAARWDDDYREFLGEHDSFDHDRWRRQQLLGSPMCEQDDPRYEAVVATAFGKQYLSSEEWARHGADIRVQARAWVLLLQLDCADWTQADLVEGSVYFLIREADLAARRFETVVAVYQQT